jgi:PEP-CTERM motif
MKKLIVVAAITTACAASVFAQGTVIFNNAVSGTLSTRVFGPSTVDARLSYVGNRSTDYPPGSTFFPDSLPIGTVGGLTGSTTFAALLGADGANRPESTLLQGAGGLTSFRSGTAAGVVYPTTVTFANIAEASPAATLELFVWDNSSGLYSDWTQGSAAWKAGLIVAGTCGTWTQPMGGGIVGAPNMINPTDPTQHARSFNLYTWIPEPTTPALLGLGAAAMLIFRRRK